MIRPALLALGVLLAPAIAHAQGSNTRPPPAGAATSDFPDGNRPVLRVALEETETIPGQPVNLRMTVLVPTRAAKPTRGKPWRRHCRTFDEPCALGELPRPCRLSTQQIERAILPIAGAEVCLSTAACGRLQKYVVQAS
jgi:hypothetical protein